MAERELWLTETSALWTRIVGQRLEWAYQARRFFRVLRERRAERPEVERREREEEERQARAAATLEACERQAREAAVLEAATTPERVEE